MRRWRLAAGAAALLCLGFVLGSAYGTMTLVHDSRTGDTLRIPTLYMAGLFDLGMVDASYPGGLSIHAYRSGAGSLHPPVFLTFEFGAGDLMLDCQQSSPQTSSVLLSSPFNTTAINRLSLRAGDRQVTLNVRSSGRNLTATGADAVAFINFLKRTPFPLPVLVSTADTPKGGLYDIPTFGVQNVRATVSRNGQRGDVLPEPPSDPFAVMARLCATA